jgi:hypothetical protein
MTAISRLYFAGMFCLALLITPVGLRAQIGSLSNPAQAAQAKTQDEFDAYLEIVSATDA